DYQSRTSMADGTPGYSMLDLGLNYRASEHLTLKAGVYNVGDRQVTNADYEMVLDGRRYTAGLVVDF
ncbi:MAG: TonB-dependent receptor, partial [Alloalcanivorax xenomutans]